jgi:CheY-like chemotaxis protein
MATTILVIDDNQITRKVVRTALEADGFAVVEAADGASAIKLFGQYAIAVVLQDLLLPDIDGFALLARLRALPRGNDTPILAFTGLLTKHDEARVSAVGFDDVISKPAEPSRLLQIIRTHLPTATRPSSQLFGVGRTMIVADDDPVQRKLVAFRMQKLGFEVVVAVDGLDALELARTSQPDLIVSDVLMPRLDGFGLCLQLRRDEALASIPVVLATNSYLDVADRELALKAGAHALILRTPDLRELVECVRRTTQLPATPPRVTAAEGELDSDRLVRVLQQLEKQLNLHSNVSKRCSLLSAELAVLNSIAEALASDEHIETALRQALAACFDAGGISLGALFLKTNGKLRALALGLSEQWHEEELATFFGELSLLNDTILSQKFLAIPSDAGDLVQQQRLLERAGVASALIVPLVHKKQSLGALVMMSRSVEMNDEDRVLFGQAVAGQIGQALAVTRAFEEKQASERVAKEQAAVLSSILDSIADAVVVADESGKFIHWNAAANAIMPLGPVSAAPDTWSQMYGLYESDQSTLLPTDRIPLVRAMRGESVEAVELFVRNEGSPEGKWLNVNAQPWRDDNDAIRGGVSAFRDVTHEKAAQMQLMLSDRMASVGMLAAGVAHEINNPLAAVLANLELSQRELSAQTVTPEALQDIREMVNDARLAADRVRQIVRDLKIFSRHEEVTPGPVDVRRVIESSLRMAWNELRHRCRVVKKLADVEFVEATESRLGQVFLNLIVNAAQAIPEGRADQNTITLATRMEPGGRVVVEVSDSGEGMSKETLGRIFTPFFTTKPSGVGTGLGLAICYRIVHSFGGEIQVESEVGKGTTVRVLLRPSSTDLRITPTAASAWIAPAARGRVLVIDDEVAMGVVVRRALSGEHDVVHTTHASDALSRIVGGAEFDVILCDLMMPQMTGMDMYRALQQQSPVHAERMIFMSGGAFTPAAREFLDKVTNQRIDKPFDLQSLRTLINAHVKSRG